MKKYTVARVDLVFEGDIDIDKIRGYIYGHDRSTQPQALQFYPSVVDDGHALVKNLRSLDKYAKDAWISVGVCIDG